MVERAASSEAHHWRAELRQSVSDHLCRFRRTGEPHELAGAAAALLRQGKFQLSSSLAHLALKQTQGQCSPAWLVLANLAAARGEPQRAIPPLLQLTRTEQALVAYKGLARICAWQGQLARATRLLILAAARHRDDPRFALALGEHQLEHAQPQQAWEAFQRCLALDDSCLPAWQGAYRCASALNQAQLALTIAGRLSELEPNNPKHLEAMGENLCHLDQPLECCEAFARASQLQPQNLPNHLNALLPVWRIPPHGSTVYCAGQRIRTLSFQLLQSLQLGECWTIEDDDRLLSHAFHCAYSPLNLRAIFEPYYIMLSWAFAPWLQEHIIRADNQYRPAQPSHSRRIRLGLLSAVFSGHSNSTAFAGLVRDLNRDRFELVLIHRKGTTVDQAQLNLNGLADVVVYLEDPLDYTYYLLRSLDLDILFFTDLGFEPYDFLIPNLRTCPIQLTGWGVPHTSGLASIDYYLSSSWLETPEHQAEYTEQLVLLDGLPGCVRSEEIQYRILPRDYFLLPHDRLLLGCVQTFWKIHPDFDLVLERIARRLPEALFVFVDCGVDTANQLFQQRLARRAPQASQQTLFLARCATADFLSLCDCLDLLLDTPYYGAGVTAYLSMYVGTPTVSFAGRRLRDRTVAGIYRYLGIDNPPIAESISDYVEQVVALAASPERRLAIKRQTVAQAHRLYDNPRYVRSFERFCEGLCSGSAVSAEAEPLLSQS